MRIKTKYPVLIDRRWVEKWTVVECDPQMAQYLIEKGMAIPYVEPTPEPKPEEQTPEPQPKPKAKIKKGE